MPRATGRPILPTVTDTHTRTLVWLLGFGLVGVGFFVWTSWADVLVPGGALLMLASARWQMRWLQRPWFVSGELPPWLGRALGALALICLVIGAFSHMR